MDWVPNVYSIGAFCVIFFGYIAQTSLLQYVFYYRRSSTKCADWKIQASKKESVGHFFWLPIFSNKPNRGVNHGVLALGNLLIASLAAGFTTECSLRRLNHMRYDPIVVDLIPTILLQTCIAIVYESVVEYYWHRLMHTKAFYATFHKYHHFYKSPEPWDDMYIHPVEAFGYYCILYGPPFLFTIHYTAFLLYMVIMGICGVCDHSGIKFAIPGLYNTVDHDNHHLKFEVNYSFPFPYMDILHNTFDGEIFGYTFKPGKRL